MPRDPTKLVKLDKKLTMEEKMNALDQVTVLDEESDDSYLDSGEKDCSLGSVATTSDTIQKDTIVPIKLRIPKESTYENSSHFPVVLHRMLQDVVRKHPAFMMWEDNGASFIIDNTRDDNNADLNNIIKPYFKHGQYQSLRGRLYVYGFKKGKGDGLGVWTRAGFRCESTFAELLLLLKKNSTKSGQSTIIPNGIILNDGKENKLCRNEAENKDFPSMLTQNKLSMSGKIPDKDDEEETNTNKMSSSSDSDNDDYNIKGYNEEDDTSSNENNSNHNNSSIGGTSTNHVVAAQGDWDNQDPSKSSSSSTSTSSTTESIEKYNELQKRFKIFEIQHSHDRDNWKLQLEATFGKLKQAADAINSYHQTIQTFIEQVNIKKQKDKNDAMYYLEKQKSITDEMSELRQFMASAVEKVAAGGSNNEHEPMAQELIMELQRKESALADAKRELDNVRDALDSERSRRETVECKNSALKAKVDELMHLVNIRLFRGKPF